jgi:hypothetical protein
MVHILKFSLIAMGFFIIATYCPVWMGMAYIAVIAWIATGK